MRLAIIGLVLLTWIPRTQGPLDLRWDSGTYYVLGTSLAEGKGYRLLNEPGEIEVIQYPPGLPALVAAHQRALGTSDPHVVGRWMRVTFAAIAVGYALAAFALLRRFLPLPLAGLGTLLCLLTPAGSNALMAEVPFALVVTLFAVFALRADRVSGYLAGLCAVCAFLIRTAGIAALVAWIAESVFRREWRTVVVRSLVAAIPVLGWQAYTTRVQADPDYTQPAYEYQRAAYLFNNVSYATNLGLRDPFLPELGAASTPELVWRSARVLPHLPAALGEVVSVDQSSWEMVFSRVGLRSIGGRGAPALAARAVLVGLGALTLLGVGVLMRRGEYLIGCLLIATMLAVCATPWVGNWTRYLKPTAPLVVLAAIQGGRVLARRVGERLPSVKGWNGPRVIGLAAALLVMVDVAAIAQVQRRHYQRVEYEGRDGERIAYHLYHYRESYRVFDAGLDWLRRRADPSDIVATTMPYWVYLRTGLRAVMPPADADPEEVLRLLDGVPVRYVMAGGSSAILWGERLLYPALRAAPGRWAPIYSSPDGGLVIYERLAR